MLVVAVAALAAGLVVRADSLFSWIDHQTIDARFSLRGSLGADRRLTVVDIDEESLAHLPRWPFSRVYDAKVLENLHLAGARLIVFDVSFDRETTEQADLALYEAARRGGPVVFATTLVATDGETDVLGGNENLAAIGARAGAADLPLDNDEVIRHMVNEVHHLPSVALAVAKTLKINARPPSTRPWLDYRGPPGTTDSLSFLNVLHGRFPRSLVRGRIVVVGVTAPVLHDLDDTSVGAAMPGPEVQANAISTVLSEYPLRDAGETLSTLLIVLMAIVVPLAGLRFDSVGVAVTSLVALAVWLVAVQLTFDHGTVFEFAGPAASWLVGSVGTLGATFVMDRRERQRLRLLFAADAEGVVAGVLDAKPGGVLNASTVIAGYELEEVVGRGGMGVVYRAKQAALNRPVAIKLIATEYAADPDFRERFRRESRAAASVDHPNVIPIYEAGDDDGLLYIAMRYIVGVDLGRLLARVERLDPARAVSVIEQLAGAIDAAHARGLVHRDVKPGNVLLTTDEPSR